jgi:inner membrane protease ATP23
MSSPCAEHLPAALSSPRAAGLLAAITRLGCAPPRVYCAPWPSPAAGPAVRAGFGPGANVVAIAPASAPPALPSIVAHELVHAFDWCRARVDRCEHLACTEVRAANLSGECDGGERGACVRRSAEASVRAHGGCEARGGAAAGVAAVWAACMADRAPFGEGGAGAPARGGAKPELVAPHLVDAAAGLRRRQ